MILHSLNFGGKQKEIKMKNNRKIASFFQWLLVSIYFTWFSDQTLSYKNVCSNFC